MPLRSNYGGRAASSGWTAQPYYQRAERQKDSHLFLSVVQLGPGRDELPDAALMTQLRDRNSGALEALYDRYSRPVYSLVLRISQQATAAEEIVQDVFLHLWRHADRYDASRGPLEPWLFTMARNRALDFLRLKSEKQRRLEEAYEADPPPARRRHPRRPPELRIDQERRAVRVRAVMAELPEMQRRAIEMAFFDGLTHSEIAAALGEPLGTVKSWIRGGLLRLRGIPGEGREVSAIGMASCAQLAELYEAYALGALEGAELAPLEEHLARQCPTCTPGVAQARTLVANLSYLAPPAEPPAALRRKLLAAISAERRADRCRCRPLQRGWTRSRCG